MTTIPISIHAPVKDATKKFTTLKNQLVISIHAPVKDATFSIMFGGTVQRDFNPRTREGCDVAVGGIILLFAISIHAPVKDATDLLATANYTSLNFNPRTREGCDWGLENQKCRYLNFNPRTREGCDLNRMVKTSCSRVFQSTHPWRMRLSHRFIIPRNVDFNPRTREGCDEQYDQLILGGGKFQSTHPWRMRPEFHEANGKVFEISIHAPVKDATANSYKCKDHTLISIHAPVKDATGFIEARKRTCENFNPRTREGCDNQAAKINFIQ